MKNKTSILIDKVMVIVHGKSELEMCKFVHSKLRISNEIVAKHNGKHSIQITSVLNLLNDSRFKTLQDFKRSFPKICQDNYNQKSKKIHNFKLFIIMDTDDCTEEQKQQFIDKEMFKNHWLYEYIVSIFNDSNLEEVITKCNIAHEKPSKKGKLEYYIKIFPNNNNKLDIKYIEEINQKFQKCNLTNLDNYLKHCIDIAKKMRL